jgi:hypothetical protein
MVDLAEGAARVGVEDAEDGVVARDLDADGRVVGGLAASRHGRFVSPETAGRAGRDESGGFDRSVSA